MPYIDQQGQCTFERKAGESIMSPEHYVCTCPGCDLQVTGKVENRDVRAIAAKHSWVVLPQHSGRIVIYCTAECAQKVQPDTTIWYMLLLGRRLDYLLAEMDVWEEDEE